MLGGVFFLFCCPASSTPSHTPPSPSFLSLQICQDLDLDHLGLEGLVPARSIRGAGQGRGTQVPRGLRSSRLFCPTRYDFTCLVLVQSQKQVNSTYRYFRTPTHADAPGSAQNKPAPSAHGSCLVILFFEDLIFIIFTGSICFVSLFCLFILSDR